ncbi:MAG: hypothetical protein F4213_22875 [Boseongicola sp. SB0677_bin_26]|nr:hypothetical protein [Boseongicola sp. SB0665_bin_10]MYG28824.1 hypothetical protein [Boseongicola sp. SB0677_bin_26]
MKIRCGNPNCNREETVNLRWFINFLGGASVAFGSWAWITYLFAGTGLALPICVAIVAGGAAMLIFKEDIIRWFNARYVCPDCGRKEWELLS